MQEDPGALVTPPKTSAAGIFTFEDNQEGDYVLDVAPEPTKKRSEVVKAGKKTLEELQVRHSLLCSLCVAQMPLYVFLIQYVCIPVTYKLWSRWLWCLAMITGNPFQCGVQHRRCKLHCWKGK